MIYYKDTIINTEHHYCRQLQVLREQKRKSKIDPYIQRPLIFDKREMVTKQRKSFSINSAEKSGVPCKNTGLQFLSHTIYKKYKTYSKIHSRNSKWPCIW